MNFSPTFVVKSENCVAKTIKIEHNITMPVHLYKPNKNNSGHACSFSQSEKDGVIYASLIKQSGWDAQKQIGTFRASKNDPTKNVNIKLAQVEVAAILDCLDRNRGYSAFHDADKVTKVIRFEPWMNKLSEESVKAKEKPVQKGYSFSITITNKEDSTAPKNSFYVGLSFAEGRLIREYLMFVLNKSFFTDVRVESRSEEPVEDLVEGEI